MQFLYQFITVFVSLYHVAGYRQEDIFNQNGSSSANFNCPSLTQRSSFTCGTRRCRIAIISDHADPSLENIGTEGAGGQNVYVRQFGEHLSQRGWTVDMFTRQWREEDPIVVHNPYCRTIHLKAGPIRLIPRDQLLGHMTEFLDSLLQFQFENQLSYDIIHTNYWLSGYVGLKMKTMNINTRLVHVCHSLGRVKESWLQNAITNASTPVSSARVAVEKNVLEIADLVIATSENELEAIRDYSATSCHHKSNVVVIPGGVNSEQFGKTVPTKSQARKVIGMDPDAKVVLYVGRFVRRKGIDILVEAISQSRFRRDPKFTLVIAGGTTPGLEDEAEFLRIRELVHVRNLANVTLFPGALSHRDKGLQLRYAAADVVVVPSRYEPFGLVAIEAMSIGAPVVASAVGGLQSTVVDGETGFLVQNGNYKGFATKIDQILENPELGTMLGTIGKKRVNQHFTWGKVTRQIENQLQKLLR